MTAFKSSPRRERGLVGTMVLTTVRGPRSETRKTPPSRSVLSRMIAVAGCCWCRMWRTVDRLTNATTAMSNIPPQANGRIYMAVTSLLRGASPQAASLRIPQSQSARGRWRRRLPRADALHDRRGHHQRREPDRPLVRVRQHEQQDSPPEPGRQQREQAEPVLPLAVGHLPPPHGAEAEAEVGEESGVGGHGQRVAGTK